MIRLCVVIYYIINYMFEGKSSIDFTNLFSPHDFKKDDKAIKQLFKHE